MYLKVISFSTGKYIIDISVMLFLQMKHPWLCDEHHVTLKIVKTPVDLFLIAFMIIWIHLRYILLHKCFAQICIVIRK